MNNMQTLRNIFVLTFLYALALLTPNSNAATVLPPSSSETLFNLSVVQQQKLQQQNQHYQQLQNKNNNFLIGIATVAWQHEGNRTACGKELEVMLKAAVKRELWTLKVLDSFGHVPQSFGWGNYYWFAEQELCDELNTPYKISLRNRQSSEFWFNITSPMPLRFVMLYANFTTPFYVNLKFSFEHLLHVGLCLPLSCDIMTLQQYALEYFQTGILSVQRDFDVKVHEIVDTREPQFNLAFFKQTGSLSFIAIAVILLSIMITAEIVHRSRENLKLPNVKLTKTLPPSTNDVIQFTIAQKRSSKLKQIIDCFRLAENWRRAMSFEQSQGEFLTVIAGFRTIVCLWVTVFHVYYYSLFVMSNSTMIFAKLESLILQPVIQACFYVDIFFVISAFLLVYHFLTHEQQLEKIRGNSLWKNIQLYWRLVGRRYMRLTPVMIVTLLMTDRFYDFVNTYSPFRLSVHSGFYCKRNWWLNLLYLHNLLDMRDICCSWMWYIACEMQFFMLFMLLLFVYARNARLAQILYVTLALTSGIFSWIRHYHLNITFQIDAIHGTLDSVYIKPWMRINPYVGGAAFGWLLYHMRQQQKLQQQQLQLQQQLKSQQQQQQLTQHSTQQEHQHSQQQQQQQQEQQQHQQQQQLQHQPLESQQQQQQQPHQAQLPTKPADDKLNVRRAAFWSLCALLYAYTNIMSYWRETPVWLVATIMSFGKLIFACCVGGVIYECANGRGGHLQTLLGGRIFLFANKFCYSVYMAAPVVVMVMFGLRSNATRFNEIASGNDFIAIVVLSCVSAVLLYVLIELPLQRVCNILLPSCSKHKRTVNGTKTKG